MYLEHHALRPHLLKKSFTFAKTFFNILNNSFQISINDLKSSNSFYDLVNHKKKNQKLNIDQYKKFIYNHSFNGILSDFYSNSLVVSTKNSKEFAKNIIKVFNT